MKVSKYSGAGLQQMGKSSQGPRGYETTSMADAKIDLGSSLEVGEVLGLRQGRWQEWGLRVKIDRG